jgi:alpha-1,6-mannosyltransferase
VVFFSLWLVIVYYPHGEDALYNWPYLAACAGLAALAAVSLRRVDPLGLTLRSPSSPAEPASDAGPPEGSAPTPGSGPVSVSAHAGQRTG